MEEKEVNIVNVTAVSKGKRILAFLADFFITLIMAAIVYNFIVYPIMYGSKSYDKLSAEAREKEDNISTVLMGNNILYEIGNETSINDRLSYTFKNYLKEYVEEKTSKTFEVFKTYYIDIKSDQEGYLNIYKEFGTTYFDYSETSVTLKAEYVTLFSPLLNPEDGLSEEGESEYSTMQNKFFLVAYSRVLGELSETDLTYDSISFKTCLDFITKFNEDVKSTVVLCTFISYGAAILVNYLLFPLATRRKKTIGMLAMKLNQIDIVSCGIMSNGRVCLLTLYQLFTNSIAVIFIPLLSIQIEYIFNLPILLWLGFVSIVIQGISLICSVISKTDQTLIDKATKTAVITNDELDNIYKNKGYGI